MRRAPDKHKVANRKELAQRLGISPNALRIQAFRLRQRLEKGVASCLQEKQDKVDDR